MLLDVECPEGVGEGELITVQAADGLSFEVAVPPGIFPGDTFAVEIEVPADATGNSIVRHTGQIQRSIAVRTSLRIHFSRRRCSAAAELGERAR